MTLKVSLTGGVALEMLASYFRDAGYDVMPQGVSADAFHPDYIFDVTSRDAALADEVPGFRDERMLKLAGVPYSVDGMRAIVDEFAWTVAAASARAPAKVLAVDADNTLWKGILTEDGPDGIVPCAAFLEGLRELAASGVVLVLLSKNNADEVDACLASRKLPVSASPSTPNLTTLFTVRKVNWGPKAGNLAEACRALNLSTDSVVFVDDNPHERAQMKAHLPEVTVAPWIGWTVDAKGNVPECAQRQLVRRLREHFFSDVGKTDEDRLRAHDYQANARRFESARHFANHDDYLDDLGLCVRPGLAGEADLDRLAQMAGKTNQFNATTLRRTRAEFAALLRSPTHRVFVFRAGDRFGEQGLVCYVVADLATGHLTDFVMSCRALGRTLEQFALGYVDRALGRRFEIDFVPTAKNRPFAEFRASLTGGPLRTHYRELAS